MDINGRFFTADYRDGQVYSGGKKYPAGHFTVQFMNQYYVQDTAARIAVFRDGVNGHILDQLQDGYLNMGQFVRAGFLTEQALSVLPRISPFDQINVDALREVVKELFTEENAAAICDYFRYCGSVAGIDQNEIAVGTADYAIDRVYLRRMEELLDQITGILSFFDRLAGDLLDVHRRLLAFAARLEEVTRLDEAHLLPLALELFGTPELPVDVQYLTTPKNSKSKGGTVARRLSFDSFYSFLVTDFFEGLHYGHYLRQCPICGNYFLMQSARRQKYCPNGYAPKPYRGKWLPCRKYAAAIHRKELAENDPIIDLYNRRCASIRAEKSRGDITPAFAEQARLLAQDRKFLALRDEKYANSQYETDLSKQKLYADVSTRYRP